MKNHYEVCGDTTVIYLRTRTNTCEAIIDTCDLERVMEYPNTWFYCIDGHGHKSVLGSATINGIKENYSLHRWILEPSASKQVDHINHDTLDNRRSNIRICSSSENGQNRRVKSTNKSGVTGIDWKEKRWRATITTNGKSKHLGSFIELKDAVLARKNAEIKYFGEFAYRK